MFTSGSYRLEPPATYCDDDGDWDDPQHVIPSGGTVTVDGGTRQIEVTY